MSCRALIGVNEVSGNLGGLTCRFYVGLRSESMEKDRIDGYSSSTSTSSSVSRGLPPVGLSRTCPVLGSSCPHSLPVKPNNRLQSGSARYKPDISSLTIEEKSFELLDSASCSFIRKRFCEVPYGRRYGSRSRT